MKCCNKHVDQPCTPDMDCWLDAPEFYNCYCVWQHFNLEVELTLHEIGNLLNLSYERIRQIEATALAKYSNALGIERTKLCYHCNKTKSLDLFRKNKKCNGGYDTECKDCYNARLRKWYKKRQNLAKKTLST